MTKSLLWCLASTLLLGGCGKNAPVTREKKNLVVAYCASGVPTAWDNANVQSIQDEAKKRGIELVFCDARQRRDEQIKALYAFAGQHAQVIAFSPATAAGYGPALAEIKRAGVPVVVCNRPIDPDDPSLYTTFLGSDYVAEGRKVGEWLAGRTAAKATIVELTGVPGTPQTAELKAGFGEALATHPDMKIIRSQSGSLTYAQSKAVMETFLRASDIRGITAVFAHNDEMALGAIRAIEAAGLQPGRDILIVSIGGTRAAFDATQAGKLNATVEHSPLIGPQLMDLCEQMAAKQAVPKRVASEERVFDQAAVAAALPRRQY